LAIAIVCLVGISALAVVSPVDRQVGVALVTGGLLVAAVGWFDDRWGLPVMVRGGAHLVAAAWAVWWLRHASGAASPIGSTLSILAIAWLINLYNFMDGVDGLAGVEALSVGGLGAVMLAAGGHSGLASAAALIAEVRLDSCAGTGNPLESSWATSEAVSSVLVRRSRARDE